MGTPHGKDQMKKNQKIEQRRSLWMATVKKLTLLCFQQEGRLTDLCPQRYGDRDQETKADALKAIADISTQIRNEVNHLDEIEQGGGIGFGVLLGRKPAELESVVLTLLTAARIDGSSAGHSVRSVGDLVGLAAIRCPDKALTIRSMFRSDGSLYSVVVLSRAVVLDEATVYLSEKSLNRTLGLVDDDTEKICMATSLVGAGRWR